MTTEITEDTKGWVFYDAECVICTGWVERLHGLLTRRGLHPVPLQSAWAVEKLGEVGEDEMKFLTRDGQVFGGADAIIQISKYIWWAWPFYLLAQISGMKPLLRHAYRILAANRHCIGGTCKVHAHKRKLVRTTISFLELP